jgi:hypothetical protein
MTGPTPIDLHVPSALPVASCAEPELNSYFTSKRTKSEGRKDT